MKFTNNSLICRGRGYEGRKKKIIREWNKTNPSPRPSETLTSDPLRQSAYLSGHELFQHPPTLTYNPYGVKDEPLRTDYPYYGYPELVNPYVHMTTRREKRKKQDSLPGGQTLTRDERKVENNISRFGSFLIPDVIRRRIWGSRSPARTSSTSPWTSSTTCCPSTS